MARGGGLRLDRHLVLSYLETLHASHLTYGYANIAWWWWWWWVPNVRELVFQNAIGHTRARHHCVRPAILEWRYTAASFPEIFNFAL